MKIIFMGTPDFAVGALEALIKDGHEITAVVTQPDKPKGRSREPLFPPVKKCAVSYNIPVLQPARIKKPEAVAQLKQYEADIFIVAAFGQILSQEILDLPRLGCLNIHASLLPKYRGASPIQHVIIDGEEKTGVTIMQMNAGLDTGDMLYKKEVAISPRDTFETLHDKLMKAGGEAVTEALALLEQGKLSGEKQREELSCYAPMIDKGMGEIDFSTDADSIDRLIRGLNPWPSAYTFYHGKQLKIWEADVQEDSQNQEIRAAGGIETHCPGTILHVARDYVAVSTGKGILNIYSMQLEGKKRMNAHNFLLGVKMQPGDVLGREE